MEIKHIIIIIIYFFLTVFVLLVERLKNTVRHR